MSEVSAAPLDLQPDDQGYYRYPSVHGERVVFVSEDDLWEVPLQGGFARRLSGSRGQVSAPALSPDGQWLAYTSTEEGRPEVYVMRARGGPAKKLTFNGASRAWVCGWSPDSERVIFTSNLREHVSRQLGLYEVPRQGGPTRRLSLGAAQALSFEPDGPGRVLARHADDLARWKRYRGGTAGVLWIDRKGDDHWERLLPEITAGLCRPMWRQGRIFFISDVEGHGNLYSCLPSGDDLQRHTDHLGHYVRFASADDTTIVYTVAGDLYRFDIASQTEARIEVDYASPRTALNRRFVDAESFLDDFTLHPRGHSLALTTRGKVFNMGGWEGAVRQTGREQGVRYRLARYLADGQRLLVVSDEGGEERFELHSVDGSHAPQPLDTGDFAIGRPVELLISPCDDSALFTNHRHQLIHLDLKTGACRVLDRSEYARIAGVSFSPDGRWAAYGFFTGVYTAQIKLVDLASGELHTLTDGEFQDVQPVFDPAGRYLYFLSYRHFDPVYDQVFFELSFPRGTRPCVITLQADADSLFLQKPRPLGGDDDEGDDTSDATSSDDDDEDASSDDASETRTESGDAALDADASEANSDTEDESAEGDESPKPVRIDLDGIGQRVEVFPVPAGNYGELAATAERVFWTVYPVTGALSGDDDDDTPGVLRYFGLKSLKQKTFARGVSAFEIGADHKTLALFGEDGVQIVSASAESVSNEDDDESEPSRESGIVDLRRVSVQVDPLSEWTQMLREAWRLMRDHFWREDMGGVRWEEIWERYSALLPRVGSRSEFSDLVWTMQGELGTSHAYEMGGDYERPPQYSPGFLGATLRWDPDWRLAADPQRFEGAYRIETILRGDTWEPSKSSPLSRPGLGLSEGDVILAINARRVDAQHSVEERLVNQAAQSVELLVASGDGLSEPRQVTTRALRGEAELRYREWVNHNRRRVHEASEGKLGYVHIPDMGPAGYAEFHRHYLSENTRQGLVVDVRFNGGGHVSQLILEKLARRQVGFDLQRWGKPLAYPMESIAGPIVALTNEHAGSDGDIFSHTFKLMKLGPLLGKRTWGGVVGIWPRHTMVDGSVTTQPEFSFWFEDVGFSVENFGTEPDVEIELPPQADATGDDPQLEAAIATAMASLKERPVQLPDFAPYPDLRAPQTLPPRPSLSGRGDSGGSDDR
ncbi:peptidase [Lujinxingia vulgaris]|uniref:Tricorn protease homolog n=1 Tax=Lujinxingia vulgaris TaxID=2600176 RepID=A0A5C6XIM3_9DELT|nr:S41 family peptidase [Lujinxingia vulgaris]TXD38759.1 peptidase [Lujinxingia vulgaris]